MKLQLALDFDLSMQDAVEMVKKTEKDVDIIEAGTPYLMDHGLEGATVLKKEFPDKLVLADLKIADAGYREAENAFLAGADIVTVLSVTDDSTIENVIKAARDQGKQVMVDMLASPNLEKRLQEIDQMGADYICLHTSKDLQKLNNDVSEAFAILKKYVKKSKVAIAGGINKESAAKYAAINPDVMVVGEGITKSEAPGETTACIKKVMMEA